jgi:hypothetical protein
MRAVELKERVEAGTDRSQGRTRKGPPDIAWGLKAVKGRKSYATTAKNYYAGKQAQMIKNERLRTVFGNLFKDFNLNMCKTVVDAVADRLRVESFSAEQGNKADASTAWKIWEANRMSRRSGMLFQETLSAGDSYLLVWPHPEPGKYPILYPQDADQMAVDYDKDIPGKIKKAVKVWYETEDTASGEETKTTVYMNLYYPDRVERWKAKKPSSGDPKPEDFQHNDVKPTIPESWRTPHKWGEVPVYHFANNADLGSYGKSELEDAIKVQDMANYLIFSLLVGVEFSALPQKYLMNMEAPENPDTGETVDPLESGVEKIWTLHAAKDDKGASVGSVGQLPGADLSGLSNVMDLADRKMATVTGTPIHYFYIVQGMQSTPASGESQKIAEFKLDKKIDDRQESFGDALAKAMGMAVKMFKANTDEAGSNVASTDNGGPDAVGNSGGDSTSNSNQAATDTEGSTSPGALELGTNWKDTRPRNETEIWTVAGLKRTAGVSQKQILREAGYTEAQITRMETENQKAAEAFGLGGPASSPDSPQGQQARGVRPPTPQENAEAKAQETNNKLDAKDAAR